MKLLDRIHNRLGKNPDKPKLGFESLEYFFSHNDNVIQPITLGELDKIKFRLGGELNNSKSIAQFFQNYSRICVSKDQFNMIVVGKIGVLLNQKPTEYATFFYEVKKPHENGQLYTEVYILDIDKMGNRIGYCTVTHDTNVYDYPYIFFTKNYDEFKGKGYNYFRYLNTNKIAKDLFPDQHLALSTTIADQNSLKAAKKLLEQGLMKKSMVNGKEQYQFV